MISYSMTRIIRNVRTDFVEGVTMPWVTPQTWTTNSTGFIDFKLGVKVEHLPLVISRDYRCAYCGTVSPDDRCRSCGAPRTR